jgi:malonyl CoA-acyl carrier protein transacylase
VRAFERAYDRSGVSPAEIGLVEAHGTGTVVGDKTELATLTEVFTAAGAGKGACALGSVKSQIGHTKCAAGMAGMIKAALSLHAGVRPPTLNIDNPNSAWDPTTSPFRFNDEARPWPAKRRRAAVSALGFGGTNFHAVLAAYEGAARPEAGMDEWPSELFVFRGTDRAAAVERISQVERALHTDKPPRLRDVARSVSMSGDGRAWFAIVADSVDDLRGKLAAARDGKVDGAGVFAADADGDAGKVAFLFPGQGSQRTGMLGDLFVAFPRLQRYLSLGSDLVDTMFPPAAFSREQTREQVRALTDTRAAQPALGIADLAMADVLDSAGVRADMLGGHSYGELVALCRAGAFGPRELIELSRLRAECILDAAGDDPGTMAAVSAPADEVAKAIGDLEGVVIANYNAPKQTVISGPTADVDTAVTRLTDAKLSARRIPVACAFHSPVVAGARVALSQKLAALDVSAPSLPVWSNSEAAPYASDPDAVRETLAGQVAMPVRFTEQVEAMYEAGARVFVEVGPGRVLSGLVGKILGDRPHRAIACDAVGDHGVTRLLQALAELAVAGVTVETAALFSGRNTEVLDMTQPLPGLAKSTWKLNGYTARPIVGEPPKGAFVPVEDPIVAPAAGAIPAPVAAAGTAPAAAAGAPVVAAAGREAMVVEYLRNMREMVSAQREVMMALLGQPIAPSTGIVASAMVMPAAQQVAAAAAPVPAPALEPEAAPDAPAVNVADTLLAIVSERTGYPIEMLDLDLDLEAELSIDSIKRIEILGELRDKVGLEAKGGSSDEETIEQLASLKTLRGIIEWLEENASGGGDAPATADDTAAGAEPEPEPAPAPADPVAEIPLSRYLVRVEEAGPPALNGTTLDGKVFALTDDERGIAIRLGALLESHGATVSVLGGDDGLPAGIDGLIHLEPLADGATPQTVKRLFDLARDAALGGARWIVGATPLGGMFGHGATRAGAQLLGGSSGLLKTIAREFPRTKVRILDVDPTADASEMAAQFHTELLVVDEVAEIGYVDGVRYQRRVAAADAASGAELQLDPEAVVLITGGARGITAKVAVDLARRYRCKLELVGRSPQPGAPEDVDLAAAADAMALRKVLVGRGMRDPGAIETECRRLLAAREIRATLGAIDSAGATATYHSIDVRDCAVFGALIDTIYARHGRLDGVIHGAGVLEDRLVRDKTPDSFARVFDTKVAPALVIGCKVRKDARFIVFFSSISGVFGNRGQVDYAAANDALDAMALSLNRRNAGRVLSVSWGPWGGTGMVSDELAREYARRGIGMIPPEVGVDRLLAELGSNSDAHAQVVLMCADSEALQLAPSSPGKPTAPDDAVDTPVLDG